MQKDAEGFSLSFSLTFKSRDLWLRYRAIAAPHWRLCCTLKIVLCILVFAFCVSLSFSLLISAIFIFMFIFMFSFLFFASICIPIGKCALAGSDTSHRNSHHADKLISRQAAGSVPASEFLRRAFQSCK